MAAPRRLAPPVIRIGFMAPIYWPRRRLARGKESATFCEQKVAKKLCYFGPVRFQRLRPSFKKVFAPLSEPCFYGLIDLASWVECRDLGVCTNLRHGLHKMKTIQSGLEGK